MRLRTVSMVLLLTICIGGHAQQTDPTLTGAVVAQTEILKKIFKDRENTQNKIIAAEAAVTVAMERMHEVENKMLDYLSNAQGAMQNLYQIKRAAQLVATEIPQNSSYNVDTYDDQGNPVTEKHKVNLLSSAERYYVANEVVSKLESINTDLWLLAWQIRTMSWQDLWYGLDPEGWAIAMSGKAIVESLIYEWKYL